MIHAHGGASLPALVAAWFGMMTAMMAPTAWPWVRAYDRFHGPAGGPVSRAIAAGVFGGGYLAAWLGYAALAAALQAWLMRTGLADAGGGASRWTGAALLVGAGAFQWVPLKHACLAHCRHPISYFLSRWRGGPMGGFRMGFGHGLYCVGCCWALMLTALAAGVMNLWWMAALAGIAFAEQVLPLGHRLRVPLGLSLIAGGCARAFA